MNKVIINIFLCLLLQSCAGMVNQMYSDFDRADGYSPPAAPSKGNFDLYRGNPQFKSNSRPPTSALTSRQGLSSNQQPEVMPSVQRQYMTEVAGKRRVRADDLRDNGASGSLWSTNDGKTNNLFTNNTNVSNGDIVLINVYNKLKNEITLELKRAFPEPLAAQGPKNPNDKANPDAAKTDEVKTAQASQKSAGDDNFDEGVTGTNRVYDRISSVVIEQIDDQHLLLRGRKDVLYKNRKRLIEIQALIPKRDLNDNNTVNSDSILEQTITVLR